MAKRMTGKHAAKAGKGLIRGRSLAEYHVLRRMVLRGETTWRQLEKQGMALPPQRRESEFRRKVKQAIAERKAARD